MTDRIQLVDVDDTLYLVDTHDNRNIAYDYEDAELVQPIGVWIPDVDEIDFIEIDEENDDYLELLEAHQQLRKIDPDAVAQQVESLVMDFEEDDGLQEAEQTGEVDEVKIQDSVDRIVEQQEFEQNTPVGADVITDLDDSYNDNGVVTEEPLVDPHSEEFRQLEALDLESIEFDEVDFSLLDLDQLADSILSVEQQQQLGNVQLDKTETGQVIIQKVKQDYEVIYPQDLLFTELVDMLQRDEVPASAAASLAAEYLNLVELNVDRIKADTDPFEQYRFTNPIIYDYLRHLKFEDNLPRLSQYWLIPIVLDEKRVYDSKLAETQRGASLPHGQSGKALETEIKQENAIWAQTASKTDKQTNTAYHQSRYGYTPTLVSDASISEGFLQSSSRFDNPDRDRQEYCIHVLRYNTMGDQSKGLELRKADGSVYKVWNKYDRSDKKITSPIVGLEHQLAIEGEVVNIIGVLRLPVSGQAHSLQAVLSDLYTKQSDLKVYHRLDQVPPLSASNYNDTVAVIYPAEANLTQLEQLFTAVIPTLDTVVQVYATKFDLMNNVNQFDQLLGQFGLAFKDLNDLSYNKLINSLRTNVQRAVAATTPKDRVKQLKALIDERTAIDRQQARPGPFFIKEPILRDSVITSHYGHYPDFGQPKDSSLNRLWWVNQQLDSGQLFYALLHYLELSRYYFDLRQSGQATTLDLSLNQLTTGHFTAQLASLDQQVDQLQLQITEAQQRLDERQVPLNEASAHGVQLFRQLAYRPLVYIDSQSPDGLIQRLSQIFVLHGQAYVPIELYPAIQRVVKLQLQLASLVLQRQRLLTVQEVVNQAHSEIERCITRLQLLQAKQTHLAPIPTHLRAEELTAPDPVVFDLFRQINNANLGKATEMYLNLINSHGRLSAQTNIGSCPNRPVRPSVVCTRRINCCSYP